MAAVSLCGHTLRKEDDASLSSLSVPVQLGWPQSHCAGTRTARRATRRASSSMVSDRTCSLLQVFGGCTNVWGNSGGTMRRAYLLKICKGALEGTRTSITVLQADHLDSTCSLLPVGVNRVETGSNRGD